MTVKNLFLPLNRIQWSVCIGLCLLLGTGGDMYAQSYLPVAVTGFNQDVIAESGPDATAVTTSMLDGNILIAHHVLYSVDFATANGIAGGLASSGTIVNGSYTYQLGSYTGKNALYLSKNGAIDSTLAQGTLVLASPASYSRLSLLVFSTEGSSNINVNLNYTDGTTERAMTDAFISDWFFGADPVISGVGRIQRLSAGPFSASGTPSNPRFYKLDMMVGCGNQSKTLESVTIADTTSSSSPRAVVLALSGIEYEPAIITPTILPARCGNNNGLVALSVTGGIKPFTYSWNTTPVQNSSVASDLAQGSYTCTITDSNGCVSTFTATVPQIANAPVDANTSIDVICAGETVTLSVATGSTPASYTWMPGGLSGSTIAVTPDTTTMYYVFSQDFYGCASTDSVLITVKPTPVAAFTVSPDAVCLGTAHTVTFTGTAGSSAAYDWNDFAGAAVQSGSNAGPYNIVFAAGGTYNLQLMITDDGCVSNIATQPVTVYGPIGTPVVTTSDITPASISFSWQPIPGATGYEVSVNGGAYTAPSSGSTGTTHSVTGLQASQTVSISVIALGAQVCQNSEAGNASAETLTDEVFIPNSFTPNNDGKNDVFRVYSNVIADMDMKVFNQWGELIFTGSNVQNGWDGTHKGKTQPGGVYIYAIKIKLVDGTELVRKGSVNLVR